MEIRSDTSFTGNWQLYATSAGLTLPAGDGTKFVYIRYRDNSGNISPTYSDTIILDTVNPTISSCVPFSGAAHQAKSLNAVVNFSENMDQSTFTTSTVYLKLKDGEKFATKIPTVMTTTATQVTLNPVTDLLYGYDYSIVVTTGVKDLSGRKIASLSFNDFTVEGDYWEGLNGNNSLANAYNLNLCDSYGDTGYTVDFIPDTENEQGSFSTALHSKLALLNDVDYYRITIPANIDVMYLYLEVLFTTDEDHGTIVDHDKFDLRTDSLRMDVTYKGSPVLWENSPIINQIYDRKYQYLSQGSGDYYIKITDDSSNNYGNHRKYNLRWYLEPGI
jgi:hypothetical protein